MDCIKHILTMVRHGFWPGKHDDVLTGGCDPGRQAPQSWKHWKRLKHGRIDWMNGRNGWRPCHVESMAGGVAGSIWGNSAAPWNSRGSGSGSGSANSAEYCANKKAILAGPTDMSRNQWLVVVLGAMLPSTSSLECYDCQMAKQALIAVFTGEE